MDRRLAKACPRLRPCSNSERCRAASLTAEKDRCASLGGEGAMLYLSAVAMDDTVRKKTAAAKSRSETARAGAGAGKIGVLLINLGTPDGTHYWAMRRYLKEFLSDRRVIEVNRVLWWLILHCVVLVKRPFASGAKYRSIWNEELDESPLFTVTRSQAEKVASALSSYEGIIVDRSEEHTSELQSQFHLVCRLL